MMFKYRIGKPLRGFVPLTKWRMRYRAELTINWFLTGSKPLPRDETGRVDNFRFITNTKQEMNDESRSY